VALAVALSAAFTACLSEDAPLFGDVSLPAPPERVADSQDIARAQGGRTDAGSLSEAPSESVDAAETRGESVDASAPGEEAVDEPSADPLVDACGRCLREECTAPLLTCAATPGCGEILDCARFNGCRGLECYCGNVGLVTCALTGQGDGPCLAVALNAPGAHEPTLVEPNAGPASEAALVVADCRDQTCSAPCAEP
jgi:hypothetical protein